MRKWWQDNLVRVFALICVAVTSAFVMIMSHWLIGTLSSPNWCRTALGAEKSSAAGGGTIKGLEACVELLSIQVKSLATNSYIFGGVVALCLLALIVIVVAGGYVTFSFTKAGGSASLGPKDAAARAAEQVADAAVEEAVDIQHRGPAMPEPPKG